MAKNHASTIADEAWQMTRDGVMPSSVAAQPVDQELQRFTVEEERVVPVSGVSGTGPRPLHGTAAPTYEMQAERPIHRLAACLCAAGLSFKQVAKRLNVHPASVSNWYRQPWFQEFMLEEMQLTGVEPIKALIAGAAHDSVLTLIELRDDEKVPASVRKQAASDLLDRAYGKAPTVVRHESNGLDATKSMEALDREIKELLGQNENRVSLAQ